MGNKCNSERVSEQPDIIYPSYPRIKNVSQSQPNPDSPSHLNLGPASIGPGSFKVKERVAIQEPNIVPGGGSAEKSSYRQVYAALEACYQDFPGPDNPPATGAGLTWIRYPIIANGEDFMKCTLDVDEDSGLLYFVAINADLISSEPEKHKLQVGDRLLMANGSTVESLDTVKAFLFANRDQLIEFVLAKPETIQENHSYSGEAEGAPDGGAFRLDQNGKWRGSPQGKVIRDAEKRTPVRGGEAGHTPDKRDGEEDDSEGKYSDREDLPSSEFQSRKNLFQISSRSAREIRLSVSRQSSRRSSISPDGGMGFSQYGLQYPAQKTNSNFFQENSLFGTLSSSSLRNARDNFLC